MNNIKNVYLCVNVLSSRTLDLKHKYSVTVFLIYKFICMYVYNIFFIISGVGLSP
jgi:hypothetical protein